MPPASNLVIADVGGSTLAAQLGIAVNAAQNSVDSGSLGLQSVNLATSLATYGPGGTAVPTGQFHDHRFDRPSDGRQRRQHDQTIGDLQQAIATATNNKVTLQLNSTGDGFQFVDQAGGAGQLKVAELGGKTAAGLHILGTGTTGPGGHSQIDSRLGTTITTTSTDTLSSLVDENQCRQCRRDGLDHQRRIDVQPQPPAAHVDEDWRRGTIYRRRRRPGAGLLDSDAGQDALLKVGSSASANTFIRTSSTNQFNSVFTGLDVDLNAVGTSPAQVSVVADTSKISGLVRRLSRITIASITQLGTLTELQHGDEQAGDAAGRRQRPAAVE